MWKPARAKPSAGLLALIASLGAGLARDFGRDAFPNADGWHFAGVTDRHFVTPSACASFEKEGRTVCLIVTPTDPENGNAYFRTARHDLAYYFEGVPEEARTGIWQQNRSIVDGFATWLEGWDEAPHASS